MRTRKWFALLMAIAMMVTVLAGCGAAKKDPVKPRCIRQKTC